MEQLTFLSGALPAKISVSQDCERAWMGHVATYPWSFSALLIESAPAGSFGKTSPASCQMMEEGHLVPSWGGLASIGYGFAYRVLDAQFFGLPQRRERVFVVGFLGDWRKAGAVLFERETFGNGRKPRYPKGEKALHTISTRVGQGSIDLFDEVNALARFGHPRRLHINEVERLFGFPDDYTLVPWRKGWMPERRRQKMLGNSIVVPVIRWIGERIATVDALP